MSTERSIPDKQRKVDEDVDSGELRAYKEAENLSENFEIIRDATIDDGIIRGTPKSIDMASTNGSIAIEVAIPGKDETITKNMDKPKVWSEKYDFVRWLRGYGYSASDMHLMIENDVEVKVKIDEDKYGDKEFELIIPDPPRSKWGQAKRLFIEKTLGSLQKLAETNDEGGFTKKQVLQSLIMAIPLGVCLMTGILQTILSGPLTGIILLSCFLWVVTTLSLMFSGVVIRET